MPFTLDIRLGNLLGIARLERDHHALHPVDSGARHVDHVLVEAGLRLVELELLLERGLDLLLRLAFSNEGGFAGLGFLQGEP